MENPVVAAMQFIEKLKSANSSEEALKVLDIVKSLPRIGGRREKTITFIFQDPDSLNVVKMIDSYYNTDLLKQLKQMMFEQNEIMEVPEDKIQSFEELTKGIEEEKKEHLDVYDKLLDFFKEKSVEAPFTLEQFAEMIASAHLKEDPEYYSKIEKCIGDSQEVVDETLVEAAGEITTAEYASVGLEAIMNPSLSKVQVLSVNFTPQELYQQYVGNLDENGKVEADLVWKMQYMGTEFELHVFEEDIWTREVTDTSDDITGPSADIDEELIQKDIVDILVDGTSVLVNGKNKLQELTQILLPYLKDKRPYYEYFK